MRVRRLQYNEEGIPDAEAAAFLAALNEACAIPSPRSITNSPAAMGPG